MWKIIYLKINIVTEIRNFIRIDRNRLKNALEHIRRIFESEICQNFKIR